MDSAVRAPSRIPDWIAIIGIMLLGLVPRLWAFTHTEVAARDSIGFIRFALELESPPTDLRDQSHTFTRREVLQNTMHPPGYAAVILAVSQPVRMLLGTNVESMVRSAQIAAILCSLLVAIPMYLLGQRLFDQPTAILAAGLFQILPVVVQLTSDGLSEGTFLLFAAWALYFGIRTLETASWKWGGGLGACIALAYLVRPEGLILGVGFTVAAGFLWLRRRIDFTPSLKMGAGVAVAFLVVAGPYIATIGGLTNKTTGKGIINYIQGKDVDPTWQFREEARAVGQLYAAWWSDDLNKGTPKLLWAFKAIGSELSKSLHYLPFGLAIIGLFFWRKATNGRREAVLLPAVLVCHLGLLFALGYKIGYVSERHTMTSTLLGCFLAAVAVMELAKRFAAGMEPRQTRWAVGGAALLLAVCLPGDFKSLHANRAGHHAAGRWLAANAKPEEMIWDPFMWAEYYAGRSLYREPERNPAKATVYTILERNSGTRHNRLPMMPEAEALAKQGEVVFHWPADKPADLAKVVVYKANPLQPSRP